MASSGEVLDVAIIGAGISGINAAYRLQETFPSLKYKILEARDSLGGTWDLFKYPGIRSDSPMLTFGFHWYPWTSDVSLAGGETIKKYIREATAKYGIDQNISYGHRVSSANWSSETALWRLETKTPAGTQQIYARFLLLGTGYYDYDHPLDTKIPGLENFKGTVIHPQFWPEDYDTTTHKNIVVIGSGATAVTLVPALAEKAARVTMLQRSPTYIAARPQFDKFALKVKRWLPSWISHPFLRIRSLVWSHVFIRTCKNSPQKVIDLLRQATTRLLPKSLPYDPHFTPRYKPWEQRFCLDANGDMFRALREEKATIVTDTITRVNASGLELTSGGTLEADTIVTATGLQIKFGGGVQITVDQKPVELTKKFLWRMSLVQDVPNLAVFFGYANTSWTLGADVTSLILTRLLKYMRRKGKASATPRVSAEEAKVLEETPMLNLISTYVSKGGNRLPKTAVQAPWQPRGSYFGDLWDAYFASVTKSIEFGTDSST